jgi:hypothetical protein
MRVTLEGNEVLPCPVTPFHLLGRQSSQPHGPKFMNSSFLRAKMVGPGRANLKRKIS